MKVTRSPGGNTSSPTPFLEVLTRAYRRPTMLAVNQASIAAQTSPDWVQTLMIDEIGIGIGAAAEAMAAHAPCLTGRFIWVLDDDDMCIRPTLVEELQAIDDDEGPDVIMLKMDHGPLGILPDDNHWQRPPVYGYIGVSAFVVRRELWQQHAPALRPGQYHSDHRFIASVFEARPKVYWFDVIASRVQRISNGVPE